MAERKRPVGSFTVHVPAVSRALEAQLCALGVLLLATAAGAAQAQVSDGTFAQLPAKHLVTWESVPAAIGYHV